MPTKKYNLDRYQPVTVDTLGKCKKRPFLCPLCQNIGHLIQHLNPFKQTETEIELKLGVNHGHFIIDKKTKEPRSDEGRNVTHYYDSKMINKEKNCYLSWKLKDKDHLPKWLRDRFDGKD